MLENSAARLFVSSHSSSSAGGTPPNAPPATATATPDREPSFNIVCRGGIYGAETRLGFQQIGEIEKGLEFRAGVAVELRESHGRQRQPIITEVLKTLSEMGFTVERGVPAFITVPEPTKTILFIRAQEGQSSLEIMRSIPPLFKQISESDDEPATIRFNPAFNPMRLNSVERANDFVKALQKAPELSTVRGLPWLAIESHAIQALQLLTAPEGKFAESIADFHSRILTDRDIPRMSQGQRVFVNLQYAKLVETLVAGPAVDSRKAGTA